MPQCSQSKWMSFRMSFSFWQCDSHDGNGDSQNQVWKRRTEPRRCLSVVQRKEPDLTSDQHLSPHPGWCWPNELFATHVVRTTSDFRPSWHIQNMYLRYHEKIKLIRHIENQHIEQYGKAHAKDIMCAVKSVAQMETFEGEYTLTDLVMKAGLRLRHVRSILQSRCWWSGVVKRVNLSSPFGERNDLVLWNDVVPSQSMRLCVFAFLWTVEVAGQRGDGCLTLKDLNRRRRMRRRQLRMARTGGKQWKLATKQLEHVGARKR